jgi:2-succinyl-6-hydroxy-2,4-cyclohexadiene-1-carboxylate synthase
MSNRIGFTLDLPDVGLHGEAQGENPRAIFLHGLGSDLASWDMVWDALPADFAAIRYDLRGFGQSQARNDAPFAHADDLLAILNARGIAQADLIGVSMGGSVAIQFALDHPERVRRLALIGPALMGWDWSQDWRALWRPITAAARAGDMTGAKQLWAAHPLFETTRASAAAPLLLASIARYPGGIWLADNQRATLPDVDRLPMLAPPVLLMSGERDLPDFRLIADLIAGCVEDVRRIDFPGCGHLLNLEAPAQVATEIADFLA